MNGLPCDVVKDLYPTIKDGCAGKLTERLVKRHLKKCTDCRYFYKEWDISAEGEPKKKPRGDFSAVASRLRTRRVMMALGGLTAFVGLAVYAFRPKSGNENGI